MYNYVNLPKMQINVGKRIMSFKQKTLHRGYAACCGYSRVCVPRKSSACGHRRLRGACNGRFPAHVRNEPDKGGRSKL